MKFREILQNIVSLFAHQRVKKVQSNYKNSFEELGALQKTHIQRKNEVKEILKTVVEAKKQSLMTVKKIMKITNALNIKERKIIQDKIEEQDYDLDKIENCISAGEITLKASTSVLDKTDHHAILAWFDAATANFSNPLMIVPNALKNIHIQATEEINKYKEEEMEIVKQIKAIKTHLTAFDEIQNKSHEILRNLEKAITDFEIGYYAAYKKLCHFGIFSQIMRTIRKIFTGKSYSDKDLNDIAVIEKLASDVLKIIHTPVIN